MKVGKSVQPKMSILPTWVNPGKKVHFTQDYLYQYLGKTFTRVNAVKNIHFSQDYLYKLSC